MAFRFVLLILLAFPLLELWVAVLVAQQIGSWLLVWLVAAALLGLTLIRSERAAVSGRVAGAMQQGALPFDALWRFGRRVMAGVLLIVPGLITDACALLLLLWPGGVGPPPASRGREVEIIEGEFRRDD